MGITKQYLKWVPTQQFGCIGSQFSGISIVNKWPQMITNNRVIASAACENVVFWDTRTGELINQVETNDGNPETTNSPIMSLVYSEQSNVLATGHSNGTVRLIDCEELTLKAIFSGHKGIVSCVTFDKSGLRLATGGKDTEIVIWDVVNNAGLFRLIGHKGTINKIEFMKSHPSILVSASNDTFIKFWDLNTQHCFKTLTGHRSEVWSLALFKNDTRLISGGSDSELKVWNITFLEDNEEEFNAKLAEIKLNKQKQSEILGEVEENSAEDLDDEVNNFLIVERYGTIIRKSTSRVANITTDSLERILVCHGKENFFECFKIRNDDEIITKVKKRLRKERKREYDETLKSNLSESELRANITLSDEFAKLDSIRVSSKIKAIDIRLTKCVNKEVEFNVALLLVNNSIEMHSCLARDVTSQPKSSKLEVLSSSCISSFGHRSDVRTVSVSPDSLSILTASADSVKIWNKASCRCVTTFTEGIEYPLCSLFLPGDRNAIIGTKNGKLQLLNLHDVEVHSTFDASEDGLPIWSICLAPDMSGIFSASEDKLVKFWAFDMVQREDCNSKQLTIVHDRTLTLDEGVICVKVSSNSKFIACSLLDSTVKIFFVDTFKFFLSLYGHKFPVLCMDISTDNTLIVTGSSDKNIKIWGMDFGDCHRSLFAHDDNIMCLCFIPNTHQFFTGSKDFKIKMWDADNFEKVATVGEHHGEIWAMAIAPNGKYLVSAAHDKTIRMWNKTSEPLILEEEKELENERNFDRELNMSNNKTIVAGESDKLESGLAEKKTTKTLQTVERLIEAIQIFVKQSDALKEYERLLKSYQALEENQREGLVEPTPPPVDPHMMVYRTECPYRYFLEVLVRIKSNELEETLLQLSFEHTRELITILEVFLQRRWEVEAVSRCLCFVIRINFGQITSTPGLLVHIDRVRREMHAALEEIDDLIGVNHAGLNYFQRIFESRENADLFAELASAGRSKRNKKHRKALKTASVLAWT